MATIKINFDPVGNPEFPTLVLAKRSGERIGLLDNLSEQRITDNLNSYSELSFSISKYANNSITPYWDEIKNNRLVWCKEWDKWMTLSYSLNEDDTTTKEVTCKSLAETELSNVNVYDMEVNTENDIAREDYSPTVLFNSDNIKSSLMHRLLKKVPAFQIKHVDSTLKNIQRTFSFNGTSIYDAFQQVAEEIQCLFIFDVKTGTDGRLIRTVSAYDLLRNCLDCGHRGDFDGNACPICGKSNIREPYGEDTGIFVSKEDLAESITFDTDTDSIKNCFKLTAGDDLMTATILNCNPNGSDSIWYLSSEMKEDMSSALRQKLSDYDDEYAYYQKIHSITLNTKLVDSYNVLIDKYRVYNSDLAKLEVSVTGYANLLNALYNAIDFEGYLQSTLMPDAKLSDTSAATELAKLTAQNLSPVAVQNAKIVSEATAKSAVQAMAKAIIDNRYQVKITSSALSNNVWKGTFSVTNYSDEDDTASGTNTISIVINDDYETYVKQMIEKTLAKGDTKDLSITGLFSKDLADFKAELKKYCLDSLKAFNDSCQGCLSVMIEQGTASEDNKTSDTYKKVYEPYYEKSLALASEIKLRESEIQIIAGKTDDQGGSISDGIETILQKEKDRINLALNFESFLGESLWQEFTTYRMDDEYSNSNYVSDGLTNAEIFDRAREFISVAEKDLKKAATATHTISTDLKNLLIIPDFDKIKGQFQTGNWIRIRIDERIYKLKLISYSIDYDDLSTIQVTFSDVSDVFSMTDSLANTLSNAQSMSKSYDAVKRQAEISKKNVSMVSGWVQKGLEATAVKYKNADNETIVMDSHGLLARSQNPITEEYSDKQAKLVSWGLAFTVDAWRTVQAAIGEFYYWNPKTQKMEQDYGVIADVLTGNLVLSESVGIYNQYNTITIDENGLIITTNGDDDKKSIAFTIQKQTTDTSGNQVLKKQLWINEDGELEANLKSLKLQSKDILTTIGESETETRSLITQTATEIRAEVGKEVKRLDGGIESNTSLIQQTAENITLDVSSKYNDLNGKISKNSSSISLLPDQIKATVKSDYIDPLNNRVESAESSIRQTAESITADVAKKYQTLDGKIESNTSSISLLPDSITSSVKTTYIDPLTARMESAEASIKINEQGIESKVSKGSIISTINQSSESVTINASKINLKGAVTISSLDSNLKTSVNNANTASSTLSSWSYDSNMTTIDGGKVAAHTITAEQIAIGDFTNYATVTENDPSTLLSDQAIVSSETLGDWIENADKKTGLRYIFVSQRFCINSFRENDILNFDFCVWCGQEQSIVYGIWFYDKNGQYINAGNWQGASIPAQYFTHISGKVKVPMLPANTKYYCIGIEFGKYGTASRNCVQKIKVTKISGYLQIGEGFIDSTGPFKIGCMQSVGKLNDDVEFKHAIFVDYGIELLAGNDGSTPYIDFHTEATNHDNAAYDYTARLQNTQESWMTFYGLSDGKNAPAGCTVQSAQFRGTLVNDSDRRLKQDIADLDIDEVLNEISKYRPVSYKYINGVDDNIHHGLIAQEAQEIAQWGLVDDRGEYLAINYIDLISDLIKVTQYSLEEIKRLKTAIDN